jgi:membrane protease YdiL (CAAX protease family)
MHPTDVGANAPAVSKRGPLWLVVCELAAIVAICAGSWHDLVPLSNTPFLLIVGWISLRLRGVTWRVVGLKVYRNWTTTLALGVVCAVVIEAFQLSLTAPVVARLTGTTPDLADFAALRGNLPLALLFLVLVWVLAALGEELVYRGYLLNRLADLGGAALPAWMFAAVASSAVFGFSHMDQGLAGQIVESFAGLWLALVYLAAGRNLAVPIIAHGVIDTIDIAMIYGGVYPGM